MRLWSLHPRYLDAKGLVAVWREGLLARKVLLNQTSGYTHHPQLKRFREHPAPLDAIDFYLEQIACEAENRGYHFNKLKIKSGVIPQKIAVTKGQLEYEFIHLKRKLAVRNPESLGRFIDIIEPETNPLFYEVNGEIEEWERVKPN